MAYTDCTVPQEVLYICTSYVCVYVRAQDTEPKIYSPVSSLLRQSVVEELLFYITPWFAVPCPFEPLRDVLVQARVSLTTLCVELGKYVYTHI